MSWYVLQDLGATKGCQAAAMHLLEHEAKLHKARKQQSKPLPTKSTAPVYTA